MYPWNMALVVLGGVLIGVTSAKTEYGLYNWTLQTYARSSVDIECLLKNGSVYIDVAESVHSWRLPTGINMLPNALRDDVSVSSNGLTLHIEVVDEDAAGIYICAYFDVNKTMRYMKHGLNLNGPLYDSVLEKYKSNFITAGSSASAVLAIIIIGCLVHTYRFKETNKPESMDSIELHLEQSGRPQTETAHAGDTFVASSSVTSSGAIPSA